MKKRESKKQMYVCGGESKVEVDEGEELGKNRRRENEGGGKEEEEENEKREEEKRKHCCGQE